MTTTLTDPVCGEEFFGRDEILQCLVKRVQGFSEGYRQNVAIVGRRSVGKSSIVNRMLATTRHMAYVSVYAEVRHEPFVRFADRWIATVTAQVLERQGIASTDFWQVSSEQLHVQCPTLAAAIVHIRTLCNRNAYTQAFEQLLRLPLILRDVLQCPPLVILESFERLEQWSIEEPFAILGRQIMVQPETMFLVTSAVPSQARQILSERFSLLFGNFEVMHIGPFDLSDSCRYLQHVVEPEVIPSRLAAFLAELVDGVPFYLHMVGRQVEALRSGQSAAPMDINRVAEMLERLMFHAEGSLHHYCAARFEEFGAALRKEPSSLLLSVLEQRRHRFGDICRLVPRSSQRIHNLLNQFVGVGVVERSGCFSYLTDPFWGLWECHVRQPREHGPDGSLAKMAEQFRNTLHRRYERFSASCEQHEADRIAKLFRLFRRDLVHINHYDRWLVPFETVDVKPLPTLHGALLEAEGWEGRWLGLVMYDAFMNEQSVVDFAALAKRARPAWHRRIIIPLAGIDDGAALLAKAEQMWVWSIDTVNFLMRLHGEPPIFSSVVER